MLRINRSSTRNHAQKKIIELQRERTKKMKQYTKLIDHKENSAKLEIVQNSPFLSLLGHYDIYELSIGSQLKIYSQAAVTHQFNSKLEKIGYIVNGKVKLNFNKGHKAKRDSSVTWFLGEGDWIGLQ